MIIKTCPEWSKCLSYGKLHIEADLLVHEMVAKLVEEYAHKLGKPKQDIELLVLGCGEGAFERRLLDMGYHRITAVDIIDEGNYKVDGITYIKQDLNNHFSSKLGGSYDIIVAIEVIEHLNSPYHFMVEISKLLSPNGVAIITTPNVSEISSRFNFLVKGELRFFETPWIALPYGHISPLPHNVFIELAKRAGLSIVERKVNRLYWNSALIVGKNTRIKLVLRILSIPLYVLMWLLLSRKREDAGMINIYVLRPSEKRELR